MNNKLDYKEQGTPPQTSANKERFSILVFGLNTLSKLITHSWDGQDCISIKFVITANQSESI